VADETLKLLVVEDDPGLQSQMRWAMSDFDIQVVGDRDAALAAVRADEVPVIVLDLGLPPDENGATEGLATLEGVLAVRPETKVIVASGNEERANAVRAISLGAYDFYAKPVDIEVLKLIISRAWHVYRLEAENRRLMQRDAGGPFGGIVTDDPEMQRVCRTIEKVASTDVTVLILGESGTGKELLAQALHQASPRADSTFVAINCAAIPENLLESELFGHERGAFTGATKQIVGKIELADGGTLFLDEIGDLPLSLQAKLLRFLQERTIERVGGRRQIPVDVRIVCATNQDLKQMMESGGFREDLYYRLNEINVAVPPLRQRAGDANLLATFFLRRFNEQYRKSIRGLSESARAAIASYTWPGNVREFENRLKKAVIMADGKVLTPEDLELPNSDESYVLPNLKEAREDAERKVVRQALALTQGNVSKSSKLLGVSRPTLYDLMRDLGIANKD
jgi:two-component system NtrC family response regulator